MLQTLREKTTGWIAFVILGAVSIPFAFFGIEHYFQAQAPLYVAKVGDSEISQEEYTERVEEIRQQARQQQGDAYDPTYFEQPEIKRQILERMIDEKVLQLAADETGTRASDARLKREITAIPAFQTEGKFDRRQYELLLQMRRMTIPSFEDKLRRDISARELPTQVSRSAFVTDAEIDRYLKLRDQTRDLRYFIVTRDESNLPTPTEDELKAFLQSHIDEFQTPEQVSLQYIEVDAATLDVPEAADDATLKQRYDEQNSRFVVAEQRLASHILVSVPANADADAQKAALAKATDLAAKAKATKDFAALARESSDDFGSKAQGGDLGWLEKGVSDPAFEAALFALAANEVSEPVKGADGYHIIQLREIKPERVKSFDEAKVELAQEFATTERDRVYSTLTGAIIDKLYEDQSTLEPVVKEFDLELKKTALFGRNGGDGIAAYPAVLKAAFSETLLSDGSVSDPIEISPNHIVVVRVDEHKPREPQKFEDVREILVQRIQMEAVDEATRARAQALGQRFTAGESIDTLAADTAATVTDAVGVGRSGVTHDPALLAEAFRLARPAEGKTTRAMVELPGSRNALVEVSKVTDGDPAAADAAARDQVRQLLERSTANADATALISALRSKFEVKVVEERIQ